MVYPANIHPIRRFYRKYLARYRIFVLMKNVALFTYREIQHLYPSFMPQHRRWLSLTLFQKLPVTKVTIMPLRAARARHTRKATTAIAASSITISGPQFVKYGVPCIYPKASVRMNCPAVEVLEFHDATIIGASSFIIQDGVAVSPDLYVPERDICMAERWGQIQVHPDTKTLQYVPLDLQRVEAAISLVGQCTGNYAHWLTETLPKLLIIDQLEEYRGLPLLIDDWMHENHFKLIEIFNRYKRPLIGVSRKRHVQVGKLVDITPPAYAPPEYRSVIERGTFEISEPNFFMFNREALNIIRQAGEAEVPRLSGPSKIFLQRKVTTSGNGRFIANIHEAEGLAQMNGYSIVEPSSLSIKEQIALFQNATSIIAPVGAALANAIFAKPGCKVFALAPYYDGCDYYYFSNFMGALGHDLKYIIGPHTINSTSPHPHHRDYRIDMEAFAEALQSESAINTNSAPIEYPKVANNA